MQMIQIGLFVIACPLRNGLAKRGGLVKKDNYDQRKKSPQQNYQNRYENILITPYSAHFLKNTQHGVLQLKVLILYLFLKVFIQEKNK